MKRKSVVVMTFCSITIGGIGVVAAQRPVVNIDKHRHGNLAAAQTYIVQAYDRINQAQSANQDQLGGHAQRAKELLVQADSELRLAANVSNSEGR